jgi:type IV pilus assembly protein PilE
MAAVWGQRGFVLIEIVLVMGLIAVLLSVLLPGYQQYVWQSHRREASQELLKLANLQQLLFAEQSRYSDDLTEFGFSDSQYLLPSGQFLLSARLTATGYLLTAEAQDSQRRDEDCLQLHLNQYGQQSSQPTAACWD